MNALIRNTLPLPQATFPSKAFFAELSQLTFLLAIFFWPISVFMLNMMLILTLICSWCGGILKNQIRLFWTDPTVIMIGIFMLIFVINAAFSTASSHDIATALHKYGKLLYIPMLVPLLSADALIQKKPIKIFLLTIGLTLFLMTLNLWGITHIGANPSAVFKNSIETGFLLSFSAYVAALLGLENDGWQRFACFLLAAASSLSVWYYNPSRTGYVVFLVLVLHFFWTQCSTRGLLYILYVLIGFFCLSMQSQSALSRTFLTTGTAFNVFAKQYATGSLQTEHKTSTEVMIEIEPQKSSGRFEDVSTHLRIQFIKNTTALLTDHWWFGLGVGRFQQAYFQQFGAFDITKNEVQLLQDPHNEYLMLLSQVGMVGLLAWLLLIEALWFHVQTLPTFWRKIGSGFILAFMAACCCDAFLYLSCPGYGFVIFCTLLLAVYQNTRKAHV